jgi:hypothetical protein
VKELHSGLFPACPKIYDLCAPNPLSRNDASFSGIYLTGAGLWANNYAAS